MAGKVHFVNGPDELGTYIAPDKITKELGGQDPWEYKYLEPQPNENALMNDTATRDRLLQQRATTVSEFEAATQEWVQGSATDSDLKSKRNAIAEKLRIGYWELDPYIRARSLYDRNGVIGPQGRIEFYPSATNKAAPVTGPAPAGHDADGVD